MPIFATGQNEDDSRRWANGTADHVVGECKYNFVGEREDEISVKEGQRINLAPAGMTILQNISQIVFRPGNGES